MTRKIVVSSLALLVGASVAGSITSTLAWFQYATKAQVAYTGSTSHCTKLLRISVDDGATWGTNVASSAFESVKFAPVTTGGQDKDSALPANFYAQPNYGQGAYANWFTASINSYAQFKVLIKVNDMNETITQLENDVFLTDVTIQDATTDGAPDLSDALRVHVSTSDDKNFLFARNSTSISVGGYLDLNNDNKYDVEGNGYEWETEPIIYGEEDAVQTSYLANDSNIIATEDNHGTLSGGTSIGKTKVSGNLEVTVTIWLEGWALLEYGADHDISGNRINKTDTQVWDSETYINKKFNVGLSFGINLHSDAE